MQVVFLIRKCCVHKEMFHKQIAMNIYLWPYPIYLCHSCNDEFLMNCS